MSHYVWQACLMPPYHLLIITSLFMLHPSNVFAVIDTDANNVQLRDTCTAGGVVLDNCFESMASLVNWMTTVRTPAPSAAAPLAVAMGVGSFGPLMLTCDAASGFTGHVTFSGAGRDKTEIRGVGSLVTFPLVIKDCTSLGFSNLKVYSPNYGYIDWAGGGTSVWENVDVIGHSRAWVETACGSSRGKHYWFSSRVFSSWFGINTTYVSSCDESWFYGSEIVTDAYGPLIGASGSGEIHVYGSNLRADDSIGNAGAPVVVASATGGGVIHIHGSGIDAFGGVNQIVQVLVAYSGGKIHANDSAYNLRTGEGGTIKRVDDNGGTGTVLAPYLWETNTEAPFADISGVTFESEHGYDTAVVTNTSDGHPHMVIYDSTCASKWFDTVTNACR